MPPRGPRGFLTEEEKQNKPKVTKELVFRIFSYLKPYTIQFIFVFITIILSAAIGLLPSMITGKIVDEALTGKNLKLLIELIILSFVSLTASHLIGVLENYINSWISARIVRDMRNEMYRHLQYMPHSFFTTEKQGDITTRMNTDISGVSTVITSTLTSSISNIATLVTSLVALFSMSWKLALVGIAVIPLLIIPSRSAGGNMWKIASDTQAKQDEMNQIINETLSPSGSLLMKLFTREEEEYQIFAKANEDMTELSLKRQRSGQWFSILMGMFTQIAPLLIYFAGGWMMISQLDPGLTVGDITVTVALVNRLYRPVSSLLNMGVEFTRSLALFSRIFDYLDREQTITDPKNPKAPNLRGEGITFRHVTFTYPGAEEPVLKDLSFEIEGNKMYAIVGPSGSGKSTIVNLIPRLYDVDKGSVAIGKTDVRLMKLSYLRDAVGMVTQEAYLYGGTIRENLLRAKEDATEEELIHACKIANIYDFIQAQPLGFDSVVGTGGLKLSGGEKQRLSLARVVLKDPQILILDEATSALDSISEAAIQQALDALMQGRTSIAIAHRLSTILAADKILVVDGGRIVEQGGHEELLEKGGLYRQLYETQFRKVIDMES